MSVVPPDSESQRGPRASSAGRWRGWLVLVALIATVLVFLPITENYFYADDFLNLYRIGNWGLFEYLVTPHGGHVLVTRNALFYLFDRLFGTHAAAYFWVVLITHLGNVYLLFRVLSRLTHSSRLACVGATLWGTSPVNEGTLGWYSVYGQVVVGTIILVIIDQLARLSASNAVPTRGARRLWFALALLASTSFGVGTGFALVLPFVIALVLPSNQWGGRQLPLWSLLIVIPMLYVGLHLLYVYGFEHSVMSTGLPAVFDREAFGLAGAMPSAFSMLEQFLRQGPQIVAILSHQIAYGLAQLVGSFLYSPGSYPDAFAYGVCSLFCVVWISGVWRSPGPLRRQLLACSVIALSCYGPIAAGRAVAFDVLHIAPEAPQARYHYAALISLTIAVCLLMQRAVSWSGVRSWQKTVLMIGWLALMLIGFWRAAPAIDHHLDARREIDAVRAAIQTRIAATAPGQPVFIANEYFHGTGLPLPKVIFPGWAAIFTIFYPSNVIDGRPLYFVEPDPNARAAAAHGRRTENLLVAPR